MTTNKMNKEVIIDGVNVAGCINYKNRTCIVDYLLTDEPFSQAKCAKTPNCYFKQLQRKEEECEHLQTEIEELKKEREILNDEAVMVEITQGKWEQFQKAEKDRDLYKQALEEIKSCCISCKYGLDVDKIIDFIKEVLR